MERDAEWLFSEHDRLLTWPREKLIGWLQWNDPNGIWTDEAMIANGMDPMTVDDAVDQIMMFVEETLETPEEMMQGSIKANPQRYPKPAEFDAWLKKDATVPNSPKPHTEFITAKQLLRLDDVAHEAFEMEFGTALAMKASIKVHHDGKIYSYLDDNGRRWECQFNDDIWYPMDD